VTHLPQGQRQSPGVHSFARQKGVSVQHRSKSRHNRPLFLQARAWAGQFPTRPNRSAASSP